MKKVEELREIEQSNLKDIKKNHPKYREGERAWGISTYSLESSL